MRYHKRLLCLPALFAAVRLMSPPAHLMLRGLPQRVASLERAWHTARRQRHIHAAECLRTPQSCQPGKANAMAEPAAHALAAGQRSRSLAGGGPSGGEGWEPYGRRTLLVPNPWLGAGSGTALSMSVISCGQSGGAA